jgi:hypothetical protein
MTDPEIVTGQAMAIADAWSPPDAPPSWWLTAATFTAIAREDVLRGLAAEIPPDRLPPLLLAAVLQYLVAEEPDAPLARHYPAPGGPQPPPIPASAPSWRRSPTPGAIACGSWPDGTGTR